ncbi:MAG: PQQ-like beta-propeller repeat protein [Deltaproteobacteria bacterium]|nr:PQQ-like beta-propeller repeat protein [Deltaproteobacteria bacterium]
MTKFSKVAFVCALAASWAGSAVADDVGACNPPCESGYTCHQETGKCTPTATPPQSVSAPKAIGKAPVVRGTKLVGKLGRVCPKDEPTMVDLNGDGTKDFLIPSYQKGKLKGYATPKVPAWWAGLRAMSNNQNFRRAGAVDGRTHELLWSFENDTLINKYATVPQARRLYIRLGGSNVVAFDARSGKRLWQHESEGTVFGILASRKVVIPASFGENLRALSPADGSVVWEKNFKGVPLAHEDTIFAGASDDRIYALDRDTGKQRWVFAGDKYPGTRDIVRGMLLVSDKKSVTAVDINTGKMRWRYEGRISSGPTIDLGETIVMTRMNRNKSKTQLFAVDAKTGDVRWSGDAERPSIAKHRKVYLPEDLIVLKTTIGVFRNETGRAEALYVADKRSFKALRPSDGVAMWSVKVPATQLIHVSGGRVLVADKNRLVRSLDARTGAEKWRHPAKDHVAQLERLGDLLFATTHSKDLAILEFETGKILGQFHLGDPFRLVPMEGDRLVVCGEVGTWIMAR